MQCKELKYFSFSNVNYLPIGNYGNALLCIFYSVTSQLILVAKQKPNLMTNKTPAS